MTNKEELKREYQDWAVNKAKSMIPTDIIVETPDWWLSKIEQARRERDEEIRKCFNESITVRDEVCIPLTKYFELLSIIKHQDE